MMYFGWNLDQWAEAVCWYEMLEGLGIKPLPTTEHALEILKEWRFRRTDEPANHVLVGVEFEKDMGWAAELFSKAFTEFCPI
jgi:hypothetical protein